MGMFRKRPVVIGNVHDAQLDDVAIEIHQLVNELVMRLRAARDDKLYPPTEKE